MRRVQQRREITRIDFEYRNYPVMTRLLFFFLASSTAITVCHRTTSASSFRARIILQSKSAKTIIRYARGLVRPMFVYTYGRREVERDASFCFVYAVSLRIYIPFLNVKNKKIPTERCVPLDRARTHTHTHTHIVCIVRMCDG